MARKKKAPEAKIVNISLTEIDLVAKGTELANRMKQVKALKDQKAEENARFQKLIDEQIELCDAVASQILGGTEARNQASLKVGEDGELTVPEKPFADPETGSDDVNSLPEVSAADAARIEAEKVAEGLRIPPAVADAIAASGGEVDLSAAKAKNGKATKGKKQPPKAPGVNAVTVLSAPTSCPDCGGKVQKIDDSGVFACVDEHSLNCGFTAVVEPADVAKALGSVAEGAMA